MVDVLEAPAQSQHQLGILQFGVKIVANSEWKGRMGAGVWSLNF